MAFSTHTHSTSTSNSNSSRWGTWDWRVGILEWRRRPGESRSPRGPPPGPTDGLEGLGGSGSFRGSLNEGLLLPAVVVLLLLRTLLGVLRQRYGLGRQLLHRNLSNLDLVRECDPAVGMMPALSPAAFERRAPLALLRRQILRPTQQQQQRQQQQSRGQLRPARERYMPATQHGRRKRAPPRLTARKEEGADVEWSKATTEETRLSDAAFKERLNAGGEEELSAGSAEPAFRKKGSSLATEGVIVNIESVNTAGRVRGGIHLETKLSMERREQRDVLQIRPGARQFLRQFAEQEDL